MKGGDIDSAGLRTSESELRRGLSQSRCHDGRIKGDRPRRPPHHRLSPVRALRTLSIIPKCLKWERNPSEHNRQLLEAKQPPVIRAVANLQLDLLCCVCQDVRLMLRGR